MHRLWRLSAARQTLWLLGLFSIISLLAWGGTFWLVHQEMTKSVDARLNARSVVALATLKDERDFPETSDGHVVFLTNDEWKSGYQSVDVEEEDGDDMRYLVTNTAQGTLVVGESIERQEELLTILASGMQLTFFITLIAALFSSSILARRGQNRLDKINAGLAHIASGKLDTEIQLDGDDDLSLIAERINDTVRRLNGSMEQIRVQSTNIAHDLRTPLARLRSQVESLHEKLSSGHEAVQLEDLEEVLVRSDSIGEVFDALLRLSQLESGAGRSGFEEIELASFAQRMFDTFDPVIADAGQKFSLQIEGNNKIHGDPRLLVQMGANLIQNAIRYGSPGQTISMTLKGSTFSFSDEGPGISIDERDKVLQPLYQVETTRQSDGHGLGLAMVKAICDLHNAELLLQETANGKGLKVVVEFPKLTKL